MERRLVQHHLAKLGHVQPTIDRLDRHAVHAAVSAAAGPSPLATLDVHLRVTMQIQP